MSRVSDISMAVKVAGAALVLALWRTCLGASPEIIRIAAVNSSASDREKAQYVCTGVSDERVFNEAIAELTRGGTIQLADGDYYFDSFGEEGDTAVLFGYNNGIARTINIEGGTENKSYNTRFGTGIHVTAKALAHVRSGVTNSVFRGTFRRPKSQGDFFTMTHVNNVNMRNMYILMHDASKAVCGINGTGFGSMFLSQVGVYTEQYFNDRFLHKKPASPVEGSIGVLSLHHSNDEMARVGYEFVNVGGLHTGFLFDGVDHLVLKACSAARCCYGYRTTSSRGHKTLTMINCCDEGNSHLPYFAGSGHLTSIDFNIERFNSAYIPDSPTGKTPFAVEEKPGAWHGYISYTYQGKALGQHALWERGSGVNFKTENLGHSRILRSKEPEFLESYFDPETRRTLTWDGEEWVDALGCPADVYPVDCMSSDLVVYGGSSAGIAAAVQARRMGLQVIVIEPSYRIGGLTTGGLGQTDIGNKDAFGGIALEFYGAVRKWYNDPGHWKYQTFSEYSPDGQCEETKGNSTMWTFEPSAALAILEAWVENEGIKVVRGERLDRRGNGVVKKGGRIVSVRCESGLVVKGRCFIDATYEGDLMAEAGVSYRVGRESNDEYGETLNGAQFSQAKYHQFFTGVDPYIVKGDPSSGLLPGVEAFDGHAKDGCGDSRVQAYCFRMCLTDIDENRIPFRKPDDYDERDYELLFRNYEQRAAHPEEAVGYLTPEVGWINSKMPCRKTDTNNCHGFSTDYVGANHDWAEGSYEAREKIFNAHLRYQQGLMWTLANHPRIPESVRKTVSQWGTCKDEFKTASDPGEGWQGQLYVREARRMIGEYVMTENDCAKRKCVPNPVAMGAYNFDSHHVRRCVGEDGFVHNEGDIEVPMSSGPYPISYGSIVPKKDECTNLIVPICLSATHIAYGSIRMEPVFFALGQAAGTAAAYSVADRVSVQDVDYRKLALRLKSDGQKF